MLPCGLCTAWPKFSLVLSLMFCYDELCILSQGSEDLAQALCMLTKHFTLVTITVAFPLVLLD